MPNPCITITDIRPNTSVDFYAPPQSWKDHMTATYKTPGLILGTPTEEMSEDQLTKTVVVEFASVEAFGTFEQDSIVQASIPTINAYNDQHDIIRTVTKGYI